MKRKIICLVLSVVMAVMAATPCFNTVAAESSNFQELNEYLEQFVFTPFPLGDYDIKDIEKSKDELLEFAVYHAFCLEYTNENYVSAEKVDDVLLKLFGVSNVEHRSLNTQHDILLTYENNRYYYDVMGDGTYFQFSEVIESHQNTNGTISLKIKITNYGMGSYFDDSEEHIPEEIYFVKAVIKPFNDNSKNTYQLLYWKNKVADDDIKVFLDGNEIIFDQPPIIEIGRTLVPVRAITEAMGALVDWNVETKTVTVTRDDINVQLVIGNYGITVNGIMKVLDAEAKIVNGRTLIPLRGLAEAFKATVNWDKDLRTITITS